MTHYIYYCWQESLKRNGIAIILNKRVQDAVLGYNLKSDIMISVHFQVKPFNMTVIQVYFPTNAEKCKIAKWLSEEVLQIAEKRREAKGKGEKKDIPL